MFAKNGDVAMKKSRFVFCWLITVLLTLTVVACNKETAEEPSFIVSFNTQGGNKISSVAITDGEKITLPENPTKDGYEFQGWYLDSELTNAFNASNCVSEDVTLYAKWLSNDASAISETSGDASSLKYTLNGNGMSYSVTGIGTYSGTALSIPSTYSGKPVTNIGDNAFQNCTDITSVTIPNSVTSIGGGAFLCCTALGTVNWNPTACTSAGSYRNPIFSTCSSLTTVNIGENVTTIPSDAFYNCVGIENIKIPDSVTSIGESAFYNCRGLTSVTLGSGIASVGEWAFYGCSGLASITIPAGVTSIGADAFIGCYNLKEVCNTTSSLTIIAGKSDNGYVGYYAKAVYTVINKELTSYTGTGTDLILPNVITKINAGVFNKNTNIVSITIPTSVTNIGSYAFSGCTSLTNITFKDTTTWYRTESYTDWANKTGGTETSVTNTLTNATYFKSTYANYYWYKV